MFYPRNVVHVLQRDFPNTFLPWLHRPSDLALAFLDAGRLKEQIRGGRRSELEVKGAIWTDNDSCWNRNARGHVGGACVELLHLLISILSPYEGLSSPCRSPCFSRLYYPKLGQLEGSG